VPNHATQDNNNAHAQVLFLCCNLACRKILQTKEIPQLASFHQVISLQLNICDECGQRSHTPQTIQIALSRISHPKELPCLGTFELILLPTSKNDPSGSLSHHTIIHKPLRSALPHLVSHTKGEKTLPKSLGLRSTHSG
jgi:hypothetical protein